MCEGVDFYSPEDHSEVPAVDSLANVLRKKMIGLVASMKMAYSNGKIALAGGIHIISPIEICVCVYIYI